MSWKTILLNSFIRGIGKTSAALAVCGVLGGLWLTYNHVTLKLSYLKSEDNENFINLEEYKEDNEEFGADIDVDAYSDSSDKKFKLIFDKL